MTKVRRASCACGQVKYEAQGDPIVTAVCYCQDCQAAGKIITDLPEFTPFQERDGGTPYATFRKDHWKPIGKERQLKSIKLKPDAPTTRYVTTCCHSALYLEFEPGFWISVYRDRLDEPPALEWRNKVNYRQSDLPFADGLPRYKNFPLRLFGRLALAGLAKILGR